MYRAVRNAALDGIEEMDGEVVTPGMFGYKHLGINAIADRVEEVDDRTAVLHFRAGQGVVNGGHGLQILRALQQDPGAKKMPPNFVKLTVVTGLDTSVIPEIAGANNSSVQVKVQSLLELEGAFDPLKRALKGTPIEAKIQWREGDPGTVKAEDIVAVMTCFRSDLFPFGPGQKNRQLINAYAYKTGLLGNFRADREGYHALAVRLPEILEFQDHIRTQPRDTYNEAGGKFGALKFVDSIHTDSKGVKREKPLPYFEMPFTCEPNVEYRLNIAAVYPILAAFRRFMKRTEGGAFIWAVPFAQVKHFWDSISVEVMAATRDACQNEGYNLNALGKSRPHWDAVERIVENAELRRELDAARAAAART